MKIIGLASLYCPLEFLETRIENLNRCDMSGVSIHWVDCSPINIAIEVERLIEEKCKFDYEFEIIDHRTTIYWTWNRIISRTRRYARYYTNVNVDECYHPLYFQRMAAFLDTHPEYEIAAVPWLLTKTKNQLWPPKVYDAHNVVDIGFTLGHFPMWRASLHDKVGMFHPQMVAIGDWDFWNRIRKKLGRGAMGVLDDYIACHLVHEGNLLDVAKGPDGRPGGDWDRSLMDPETLP